MNDAQAVSDHSSLGLAWTGANLVGARSSGAAAWYFLCIGGESCNRFPLDLDRCLRDRFVRLPGDARRVFVANEFRIYGLVDWPLSSGSASPGDRTTVSRGARDLSARAVVGVEKANRTDSGEG